MRTCIAEEFDPAIAEAEKAFAGWNTPEQLKQEEKFETIRGRRSAARAGLTYWLADAHMKKADYAKVVATLKDYGARFPGAQTPYPSLALGHQILANLELGNLEDADRLFRTLLRKDPKFRLPPADHVQVRRPLQRSSARCSRSSCARSRPSSCENQQEFRVADEGDVLRSTATLADLKVHLANLEKALELFAAGEKVDEKLMTEARDEAKDHTIAKRIEELSPRLTTVKARHTELETTIAAQLVARHDLEQEIYEPLT